MQSMTYSKSRRHLMCILAGLKNNEGKLKMNIAGANGYTLNNLGKINVILGKNGCGKSTLLKKSNNMYQRTTSLVR